ncbi:MAG: hypothetical protein AAF745_03955, partial [Planctomycetota bacterium]
AGAAAILGLLLGFRAGRRSMSSNWALAAAAAVGWAILPSLNAGELVRLIRPRVAFDGLPVIMLIVGASVQWLHGRSRWQIGAVVVLGVLIPAWLLWGSIHLREPASLWQHPATTALIFGWSLSLITLMILGSGDSPTWTQPVIVGWVIATIGSAVAIATTGSLAYAVAVGILGVATLSVLIGSRRLPLLMSLGVSLLIGLAAAFSELPWTMAATLQISWLALIAATVGRLPIAAASNPARVAVVATASLVTLMVAGFTSGEMLQATSEAPSGYASQTDPAESTQRVGSTGTSTINQNASSLIISNANEDQAIGRDQTDTKKTSESDSATPGSFDPFGPLP